MKSAVLTIAAMVISLIAIPRHSIELMADEFVKQSAELPEATGSAVPAGFLIRPASLLETHPEFEGRVSYEESATRVTDSGLFSVSVYDEFNQPRVGPGIHAVPSTYRLRQPVGPARGLSRSQELREPTGRDAGHSSRSTPGLESELASGAPCVVCRRPRTDYTQTAVFGIVMVVVAFRSRRRSKRDNWVEQSSDSVSNS